jgi:hypothetical protein
MLQTSSCVDPDDAVISETVDKVAATISAELDQQPTDAALQSGISSALSVPDESVDSVSWDSGRRLSHGFLDSAGRRLQAVYTISYEVVVPAKLSRNAVLRRAVALALEGSVASQALKASFNERGISLGSVRQVVAPRAFEQVVVKIASSTTRTPATSRMFESVEDTDGALGIGKTGPFFSLCVLFTLLLPLP